MRFKNILVDMSNMYYKAYYTSKHLTFKLPDGTDVVTGGVYTTIKSLQLLEREYLLPGGSMFFIFDETANQLDPDSEPFRKSIDPEYKANRKKNTSPSFYWGLNYVGCILRSYRDNFFVVKSPGIEADDFVRPLLKEFSGESLLVSSDLDWARSIGEGVMWMPSSKEPLYGKEEFKAKYKFLPDDRKLMLYKTFRGDVTDNIPKGVLGIGEDLLLRLINEFNDIDSIIKGVQNIEFLNEGWKNKIYENRGRLQLNFQLVDFLPISHEMLEQSIVPCKFESEILQKLYRNLGFNLETFDEKLSESIAVTKSGRDMVQSGFFVFEKIKRL